LYGSETISHNSAIVSQARGEQISKTGVGVGEAVGSRVGVEGIWGKGEGDKGVGEGGIEVGKNRLGVDEREIGVTGKGVAGAFRQETAHKEQKNKMNRRLAQRFLFIPSYPFFFRD
jgi:hypothetical protein